MHACLINKLKVFITCMTMYVRGYSHAVNTVLLADTQMSQTGKQTNQWTTIPAGRSTASGKYT